MDPLELPASVHILDVSCDRSIETFRESCVDDYLGGRIDFLFNNAGVCLPEENEDGTKNRSAAAGVLQETLTVNFFGGLKVVENCVPALTAAATTPIMHDGQATGGAVAPAEVDAVTTGMMPLAPPTVVWISSGEGELCFLGSKWRGLLADAKNLQVWGAVARYTSVRCTTFGARHFTSLQQRSCCVIWLVKGFLSHDCRHHRHHICTVAAESTSLHSRHYPAMLCDEQRAWCAAGRNNVPRVA